MFRIHADQVSAFAARMRAELEGEAARLVEERLGRRVDAGAVTASVSRALARRIETEPEVLQHVVIEGLLGGDLLAAWPWAAAVLDDEHLTPLGKLRTVLREARLRGVDVAAADLGLATARAS